MYIHRRYIYIYCILSTAACARQVASLRQLGAGPMTFLQDYATHAALRHELTLDRREGQLEAGREIRETGETRYATLGAPFFFFLLKEKHGRVGS